MTLTMDSRFVKLASVLIIAALVLVTAYFVFRPRPVLVSGLVVVTGANGSLVNGARVGLVFDGRQVGYGVTANGSASFTSAPEGAVVVVDAGGYGQAQFPLAAGVNKIALSCQATEFVALSTNKSGTAASDGVGCDIGDAHTRFRLNQLVTEFAVRTPSSPNATGRLDCGNGQAYDLENFSIAGDVFLTACGYVHPGWYPVNVSVNGASCSALVRADFPCGTQ